MGLDILGLDILGIICFVWVWIVLKVLDGYIVLYQKQHSGIDIYYGSAI